MGVVRELHVDLTGQQVFNALKYSQKSAKLQLQAEAKWAVNMVNAFCKPKAVYELFSISFSHKGKVRLQASKDNRFVDLNIGQRVDLISPAKLVQVSVVTLGREIDAVFKELQRRKQTLRAYILDIAAVIALDQAGKSVNRLVEKEAALRGWGVGICLSPGSLSGWSLRDQVKLCSLLSLAAIGVEVSDGCVLFPLKSASSLIGLGPGYRTQHVGFACNECSCASNCTIFRSEEKSPF